MSARPWWGPCPGAGIHGLWGANGVLYVNSQNRLSRWENGRVETIVDFSCETTIKSMWGNSPSEAYLVAADTSRRGQACGVIEVFRVNGTQVTQI